MVNEVIILLIIALLLAIVFVKYIWFSASKEINKYVKLENDSEYREKRLETINELIAVGDGAKAELIYERATIYALAGEYKKSAENFVEYMKLEPDDTEGWAELTDAYIGSAEYVLAREAIDKAVALEPEYAEYRLLQLKVGLYLKNVCYSEKAFNAWADIDKLRVAENKRPHRWSPLYQIGYKNTLADPAVKVYGAALAVLKGDNDSAKRMLLEVERDEPEYLDGIFAEDKILAELKEVYEA